MPGGPSDIQAGPGKWGARGKAGAKGILKKEKNRGQGPDVGITQTYIKNSKEASLAGHQWQLGLNWFLETLHPKVLWGY